MPRNWYVTPTRVRPGFYIPGRYEPSDGYWMGPIPSNEHCKGEMEKVRGPFPSAKEAAEEARRWREDEGKHSDIYLCLTEGDFGEVTHCNLYDPEAHVVGERVEVSEAERRSRASGEAEGHEAQRARSEQLARRFPSLAGFEFDPDAEPAYKIERRPYPPWRPGMSTMVNIQPMSATGKRGIAGSLLGLLADRLSSGPVDPLAGGFPPVPPDPKFALDYKYRPGHEHEYERGGKCRFCDEAWCPHPEFVQGENIRPVCTTCGCLEPLPGTRDHYEVPLGPVQPCLLGTYPEEEALMRTSRDGWLKYRKEAAEGTFKPKDWNWAVGENAVEVADPSSPKGYRYEKRVCIFIMGDGSEQCLAMFPLEGKPSPEQWDLARQMIRTTFGVERIIDGV